MSKWTAEQQRLLDKILEMINTLSEDELRDIYTLIEDYLGSGEE